MGHDMTLEHASMNDACEADLSRPHALQPLWDLASAAVRAEALRLALELRLPDLLLTPRTAADVAARCDLAPGACGHLLDLLWSMALCERHESPAAPTYSTSADARRYLCSQAPESCASALQYRLDALRQSALQLRGQLGLPAPAAGSSQPHHLRGTPQAWAAAARVQIAQEQRAVTVPAALAVLRRLPRIERCRRLLDLGGGPGLVAVALALRLPGLHGVVFDWPEAVAVARENIGTAGLTQRLSVRGGDLASDDIGSGYDLVWCSSVLHFVADPLTALRKIYDALDPGGLLVCAHAEIGHDAGAAAQVMPFYLPMLMQGRHVPRAGEWTQALLDAGFEQITSFDATPFPMAPLRVLVGRRAGSDGGVAT